MKDHAAGADIGADKAKNSQGRTSSGGRLADSDSVGPASTPAALHSDTRPAGAQLIWLDFRAGIPVELFPIERSSQDPLPSVLAQSFFEHFDLHYIRAHSLGETAEQMSARRMATTITVFEYDQPTQAGLRFLYETRRRYADLPIVMFTLHHSEELAVWALRNRVWDYFIKPIDQRALHRIAQIFSSWLKAGEDGVITGPLNCSYPSEARLLSRYGRHLDMASVRVYLETNYAHTISEREIALHCRLSPATFTRAFRRETGTTFHKYLTCFRVEKAVELLDGTRAIADVATATGFRDPNYFARVFKRLIGESPSQYCETRGLQ